ncbi:MAG: SDR family oxidoreductase [Parvularculaceae bacterium]
MSGAERLAGKKAFVTGAAGGLGACSARMLAEAGARVFLTDIDGEGAAARAAEINERRPDAAFAAAHDVADEDAWRETLADAAEAMGGLNVLVNSAGVGSFGTIETETPSGWRRAHAINVDAVFIGTQLALPSLKASAPASIVNVASIAAMVVDPRTLAYNVSKAAVTMLSKSTAVHCARAGYDVRCNSVHPGYARTSIIEPLVEAAGGAAAGEAKLTRGVPMGRVATPEEVGGMVVYLASDEARFVTGAQFVVDGGRLCV